MGPLRWALGLASCHMTNDNYQRQVIKSCDSDKEARQNFLLPSRRSSRRKLAGLKEIYFSLSSGTKSQKVNLIENFLQTREQHHD
jgi:hypothetical protein